MISVVIPTYKSPEYLDWCLHSCIEGQVYDTNEIIVIVDGHYDMSKSVLDKYEGKIKLIDLGTNKGMCYALNTGMWYVTNEYFLIVNDDNVFPDKWDEKMMSHVLPQNDKFVLTPRQIEPTGPSIFDFNIKDFGRDAKDFRYDDYIEYEKSISQQKLSNGGEIFPFLMKKKYYMAVGGFDLIYPSPFICDWDFFVKLELIGCKFKMTHGTHFYHFGSKATKNRDDNQEKQEFTESEVVASQIFYSKWGFQPMRHSNNSHSPGDYVHGIKFPNNTR